MPMVVIVLSLPKVSVGLSPFSLGLPAPCDLALVTTLVTGPSPHWPTSPGGVYCPMPLVRYCLSLVVHVM